MYKSFRVKNFRCFKDLRINDLGRVNLIAGKNNTGKTALMEAMYTFTRPLSPQVLLDLQGNRDGSFSHGFQEAVWKFFFRNLTASDAIEFSGQKRNSNQQSSLSIRELKNSEENAESFLKYFRYLTDNGIKPREATAFVSRANAMLELVYKDEHGKTKETQFLAESPIPVISNLEERAIFIPQRARLNKQSMAAKFTQADLRGELGILEEMIQLFEPKLSDLRLLSPINETEIWATIGELSLPITLLGDGVNQICNFMLSMFIDPSYLFVDEIENGIHHSVQVDIWKTIGKLAEMHNIQVFATTHSYEMIQAAHEAFKNDDPYDFRYHRLDRKPDGDIEAVTYNEFGVNAAMTTAWEVRG